MFLVIHPNLKLLSNSSEAILNACPRLFELDRLTPRGPEEADVHTDFGKVVGVGVQDYLVRGDKDQAIIKMFSYWKGELDEDADSDAPAAKKTFWHALYALDKFISFRETALGQYKVVEFNHEPAIELGFIIDCGEGFKYRGKLDALLWSTSASRYSVFDCKTTGSKRTHDAMFKHSGQGLGYSLVVDAIAHAGGFVNDSGYEVIYGLYKTPAYEWEQFRFLKSHTQRALWIKQLLISMKHIAEYAEEGFFPMHGESCYRFYKPCKFFDLCEMSNTNLVGDSPEVKVDKEEDYPFKFSLDEIIEAQLAKQGSGATI